MRKTQVCGIVAVLLVSVLVATAQGSKFHTDPPAVIKSMSQDLTVLHKELSGYGNYGTPDGRSDILYSTESDQWVFDLSKVHLPGSIAYAEVVVRLVLDDHYRVEAANYVGAIKVNGTEVFAGSFFKDLEVPHGAPFGRRFNNWKEVSFKVSNLGLGENTISIENKTAGRVGGDWIAIDSIQLRVHTTGDGEPTVTVKPTQPEIQNPVVTDVVDAFSRVRSHGDKLGFWEGDSFPDGYSLAAHASRDIDLKLGLPPKAKTSHFQGIQRLRSGPYFAASGSSFTYSHLFIVKLASRPSDGCFRSNRLTVNLPPQTDKVVWSKNLSDVYWHAGGLQAFGDYLVVGIEDTVTAKSRVLFFNVQKPETPVQLDYVLDRPDEPAGAVGIVDVGVLDGKFLLVVGRTDSAILDFYVSNTTDLNDPDFRFDLWDTWYKSEVKTELKDKTDFYKYQNLNLLRDADGKIFMVGLSRTTYTPDPTGMGAGRDFADLFRIDLNGTDKPNDPDKDKWVSMTMVGYKQLVCQDECNFNAGAGVYLDPRGRMMIYGIEHFRNDGLIRFNEFRSLPIKVSDIGEGWVELYDDVDFKGRSIMIDYVDRKKREYKDYDKVEGFEDKASSAKWLLPSGWSLLLFEDKNYKGRLRKLTGNGDVRSIADFGGRDLMDPLKFYWGDKVSSSRFVKEPITSVDDGWIELFEKENFKGRRVEVDTSQGISRYKELKIGEDQIDFNDKVSSVRWQLPQTSVYRLYQHANYEGEHFDLKGNGKVQEISNFNDFGVSSSKLW